MTQIDQWLIYYETEILSLTLLVQKKDQNNNFTTTSNKTTDFFENRAYIHVKWDYTKVNIFVLISFMIKICFTAC